MATILTAGRGRVTIKGGVEREMGFVLGVIEDAEGLEVEVNLAEVDCISEDSIGLVVRLLQGETAENLLARKSVTEGDSSDGEITDFMGTVWQTRVVSAISAASFLQAHAAETSLCVALGKAIRESCCSDPDEALSVLGIEARELKKEESEIVDGLLVRARLGKLLPFTQASTRIEKKATQESQAVSRGFARGDDAGRSICAKRESEVHQVAVPGIGCVHRQCGCDEGGVGHQAGGFQSRVSEWRDLCNEFSRKLERAPVTVAHKTVLSIASADMQDEKMKNDGRLKQQSFVGHGFVGLDSVHGIVCRAAVEGSRPGCALNSLSEDLLCKVAMYVGTLVPDIFGMLVWVAVKGANLTVC